MKFVVKLFPEITIKTRPVRKLLTKQLASNIRNVLTPIGSGIQVKNGWDAIEVYTQEDATDALNDDVYEALTCHSRCCCGESCARV